MKPVRCTILSPYSEQRGGAELSLLHALRRGEPEAVQWSLAVPREGEIAATARSLGIPTRCFGVSRTRNPIGFVRSVATIRSLCVQNRSQLLLSWVAQPHFRAAAVAAVSGTPTAWFRKAGVDDSWTSRCLARLPARAILANSLYTAERQAAAQQRAGAERPIYVVPSAVDLDAFDPERLPSVDSCRRELGLPLDRPLIVLVGRLQSWKGFHVLLEALPAIRRQAPTAELVLVGGEHASEPGYRQKLERLAAELGVAEAVHLVGFATHDRIAAYMQAADVIVHASVGEPFGIVVIEALALGKPVVAANEGGPTGVITHGVDGLLTDPTDPSGLAENVGRLLCEGELSRRLGRAAAERARLFSIERFGRRLADAVRSIIDREHRSGIIVEDALRTRPTER